MTLEYFLTTTVPLTGVELLPDNRIINVIIGSGSLYSVIVSDIPQNATVTSVQASVVNGNIVTENGLVFSVADYVMRTTNSPPINPPITPPITTISRQEFMDRIGDDAVKAIIAASKQSIDIEAWLLRYNIVPDINVTDPRTIAGVDALIAAGLIPADRRDVILAI